MITSVTYFLVKNGKIITLVGWYYSSIRAAYLSWMHGKEWSLSWLYHLISFMFYLTHSSVKQRVLFVKSVTETKSFSPSKQKPQPSVDVVMYVYLDMLLITIGCIPQAMPDKYGKLSSLQTSTRTPYEGKEGNGWFLGTLDRRRSSCSHDEDFGRLKGWFGFIHDLISLDIKQ